MGRLANAEYRPPPPHPIERAEAMEEKGREFYTLLEPNLHELDEMLGKVQKEMHQPSVLSTNNVAGPLRINGQEYKRLTAYLYGRIVGWQ